MSHREPKSGSILPLNPHGLAALKSIVKHTSQKIAADSLGVSESVVRGQLDAGRVTDGMVDRLRAVGAIR